MKLHVIHTSDRADRLKLLNAELATQNITDYRIWEGVKIPGNNILGVSNSHKNIVKWAMENRLPEVCIAENDIKFLAPGAWDYFLSQKPEEYDMYLGGVFFGAIHDNLVQDFCGMTLYMVSERFYRLFLTVKDIDNIDRALAVMSFNSYLRSSLKYHVCDPFVVSQWGGYSDNKNKIVEDYDHLLEGRRLFGQ